MELESSRDEFGSLEGGYWGDFVVVDFTMWDVGELHVKGCYCFVAYLVRSLMLHRTNISVYLSAHASYLR